MTKRIMIDQCTAPFGRRTFLTEEDIEKLATDILNGAMRFPILVMEDRIQPGTFHVIDGLARIEAVKKMGHVTIEAVVTDSLTEASKLLQKVNRDITLNPLRICELCRDLGPLLELNAQRNQIEFNRGVRRQAGAGHVTGSVLMAQAVGLGMTTMKRMKTIYNWTVSIGPEGESLLEAMRTGELTYHQVGFRAKRIKDQLQRAGTLITDRSEQLELMSGIARQMNNAVKAAEQLGPSVSREDKAAVTAELRKSRSRLSTLIHTLEKE